MQKALSRRTALTVLGLGTAATIAPEDFSQPVKAGDKEVYFDVARREAHRVRITTALRGLADDIDAGGSHVQEMRLASAVKNMATGKEVAWPIIGFKPVDERSTDQAVKELLSAATKPGIEMPALVPS